MAEVSHLETRIVSTDSVELLGRFPETPLMFSGSGQQQGTGAALILNFSEDLGVQQL